MYHRMLCSSESERAGVKTSQDNGRKRRKGVSVENTHPILCSVWTHIPALKYLKIRGIPCISFQIIVPCGKEGTGVTLGSGILGPPMVSVVFHL